jgi:hypothetical protein
MSMLKAGAARVDISPPLGTQLAGDIGRHRPVEEIRDPIYASALVLEKDGRKFCILSLDLTILIKKWVTPIRQQAAARFGFEEDAIMVCATQTHSSVAFGHAFAEMECEHISEDMRWLLGGDDNYHGLAVEQSLQAIEQAHAKLEPVTVGAASGIEGRVCSNRRFLMRDGTTRTHPPTADPNIRYAEGPIDPEVGLVCFRNQNEEVIAALLHFTSHPNHGYPHLYVSADWPGAWCDGVRELLGETTTPLVLNGCCGNIHHRDHLDPHHVDDHLRMGRLLTETTATILPRIEYKEVDTLDWKDEHLQVPWRDYGEQVFKDARQLLSEHPTPLYTDDTHMTVSWEWMYAVSVLDVEKQMQQSPYFDYEIQTLRIGDIAIAALPGEPFVEGQLQIKLESPTYPTYIAHMSNIYAGYIPTEEGLRRGGFETRPSNWSKLGPPALGMIVEKTGAMFNELFATA